MNVKVSPKYQVVIPEEVRRSIKIVPGMRVSVIAKGGIAYLVPLKSINEIGKSLGKRLSPRQKKEMQKSLREKRDRKL